MSYRCHGGRVEDDPYDEEDPYEDPAITRERIAREWYKTHPPDWQRKRQEKEIVNKRRPVKRKRRTSTTVRKAPVKRKSAKKSSKKRSLFDLLWN